jgi:membrane protein implicated in regulation of membrane protease activity
MNGVRSRQHVGAAAVAAIVLGGAVQAVALPASEKTIAGSYALRPTVIGVGAVRMQGVGGWSLDGTSGQVDAIVQSGAGSLRLDGGFWRAATGAAGAVDRIFANGFESAAAVP